MVNFTFVLSNSNDVLIESQLELKVDSQKVWNLLSSVGHLEIVHPFCQHHSSKKWKGLGDQDLFVFYNEKAFQRTVVDWKEGVSFTLDLKDETDYEQIVTFKVEKSNRIGNSFISIIFRTNSYAGIIDNWDTYCEDKLVPDQQFYFGSLLKGFKHYLETGQKVKRNLFGKHPVYSPD